MLPLNHFGIYIKLILSLFLLKQSYLNIVKERRGEIRLAQETILERSARMLPLNHFGI